MDELLFFCTWLSLAGLFVTFLKELLPNELFIRCAKIPEDKAAWAEFFKRYQTDIYATIYRVLGTTSKMKTDYLFKDILQKFYMQLLVNDRKTLLSFRGRSEPEARAYLRQVAATASMKALKKKSREATVSLDADSSSDDNTSVKIQDKIPDRSVPHENYFLLKNFIDGFLKRNIKGSKKYRNTLIFKLALIDGFSSKEIAAISGLRINSGHAIEQLLSRIRQKMRSSLEK